MTSKYEELTNGIEAICEGHSPLEAIGALSNAMTTFLSKIDPEVGIRVFVNISALVMKNAYPEVEFKVIENDNSEEKRVQ